MAAHPNPPPMTEARIREIVREEMAAWAEAPEVRPVVSVHRVTWAQFRKALGV